MLSNTTIYQVDAFSDELFKGNPAGVMIVDDQVTEHWMQQMAMEMNLSETAFVIPRTTHFDIRYFTPTVEIPLCGHATLASAHILYQLGVVPTNQTITFHAKGGILHVFNDDNWIVMNFPSYPIERIKIPTTLKNCIGFEPLETYTSSYGWIIAVAAHEKDIVHASPLFERLKEEGLGHLMITAASTKTDYVVRCFAPSAGINEDPVTGSAQCALVPLWHSKTGKTSFTCEQVSARTGLLKTQWLSDRVLIKGKCKTVFKATIEY